LRYLEGTRLETPTQVLNQLFLKNLPGWRQLTCSAPAYKVEGMTNTTKRTHLPAQIDTVIRVQWKPFNRAEQERLNPEQFATDLSIVAGDQFIRVGTNAERFQWAAVKGRGLYTTAEIAERIRGCKVLATGAKDRKPLKSLPLR
jgi:hypothetical protein